MDLIARYRRAFAAAKTPRITEGHNGFVFQYEPNGPHQHFSAEQFAQMIEHLEGRAPLLDNGVTLSLEDDDSGNGPRGDPGGGGG